MSENIQNLDAGPNGRSGAVAAWSELERQVERGSLYTHTALGQGFLRLSEVESFTYGLIDALLARGILTTEDLSTAIDSVRTRLASEAEGENAGVVIRMDKAEETERPSAKVDCASRMHVCQAVCCKLEFALATDEVEKGTIKWDLGRPYFIRHEADGHCTHIDRATGTCDVYDRRPSVCRNYSCAGDERIWKDFEKMELNQEWIDEHVRPTQPRALRVLTYNCGQAAGVR